MKTKLHKLFLPTNYALELYERFHSLKYRGIFAEEYAIQFNFNNLSIRVGIIETNVTNEQITSHYLVGKAKEYKFDC